MSDDRGASFALSYAKDLTVACVTAGHTTPDQVEELTLGFADSLLKWLADNSGAHVAPAPRPDNPGPSNPRPSNSRPDNPRPAGGGSFAAISAPQAKRAFAIAMGAGFTKETMNATVMAITGNPDSRKCPPALYEKLCAALEKGPQSDDLPYDNNSSF